MCRNSTHVCCGITATTVLTLNYYVLLVAAREDAMLFQLQSFLVFLISVRYPLHNPCCTCVMPVPFRGPILFYRVHGTNRPTALENRWRFMSCLSFWFCRTSLSVTQTRIERVSLLCDSSVLPLVSKAILDTFGVEDDCVFVSKVSCGNRTHLYQLKGLVTISHHELTYHGPARHRSECLFHAKEAHPTI